MLLRFADLTKCGKSCRQTGSGIAQTKWTKSSCEVSSESIFTMWLLKCFHLSSYVHIFKAVNRDPDVDTGVTPLIWCKGRRTVLHYTYTILLCHVLNA